MVRAADTNAGRFSMAHGNRSRSNSRSSGLSNPASISIGSTRRHRSPTTWRLLPVATVSTEVGKFTSLFTPSSRSFQVSAVSRTQSAELSSGSVMLSNSSTGRALPSAVVIAFLCSSGSLLGQGRSAPRRPVAMIAASDASAPLPVPASRALMPNRGADGSVRRHTEVSNSARAAEPMAILDEGELGQGLLQQGQGHVRIIVERIERPAMQVQPAFLVISWRGHNRPIRPEDRNLCQSVQDRHAPATGLADDGGGQLHGRIALAPAGLGRSLVSGDPRQLQTDTHDGGRNGRQSAVYILQRDQHLAEDEGGRAVLGQQAVGFGDSGRQAAGDHAHHRKVKTALGLGLQWASSPLALGRGAALALALPRRVMT